MLPPLSPATRHQPTLYQQNRYVTRGKELKLGGLFVVFCQPTRLRG
jgi:hypothetical protein